MNLKEMQQQRIELNNIMMTEDDFYKEFSELDSKVYTEGAISKKHN